jgi:3-keto-disaccharide hydrolase
MNARRYPLFVAMFLSAAACAGAEMPSDTFNRADDEKIGKTEVSHFSWIEIGEKSPKAVRIEEGMLWLDYVAGSSSEASANVDEFTAADVTINVKVFAWYGDDVRVCGISYRLDSSRGQFDSEGYHALLNKDFVRLAYGTNTVAEKTGSFEPRQFHTLKVVAKGKQHQVYVDGSLLLDVTDNKKLSAGYVGLTQYYEQAKFDDFSVTSTEASKGKPQSDLNPLPDSSEKKKTVRNRLAWTRTSSHL